MSEGRQVRGAQHHFARLSEEDVLLVKRLLEQRERARKLMEGLTLEAIARRVGCGKNAIYHISKGHSWCHLQDEVNSEHG